MAWGVHHFDIVHWAMGVQWPDTAVGRAAASSPSPTTTANGPTRSGILEYGPGPVAKNGFVLQYTMRIGCRADPLARQVFLGSSGSLLMDRAGYTITSEEREAGGKREKIIEEDTFRSDEDNHQQVFLDHLRNRTMPEANVETGHFATLSGHLLNLSYLAGRKILWDGNAQQAIDDPKANELIHREIRALRGSWRRSARDLRRARQLDLSPFAPRKYREKNATFAERKATMRDFVLLAEIKPCPPAERQTACGSPA